MRIMDGIRINLGSGELSRFTKKIVRKLSDMKDFYYDKSAVKEILMRSDPIIYEVYAYETEKQDGNLSFATTILYPGKIGREFYMTKGHFHEKEDRAEVYVGLSGTGLMLIMDKNGETKIVKIEPNSVIYVPPYHAHRAVNIGDKPLIFLAIYPSDAGHNYGDIKLKGFSKIVIQENGEVKIIDNPNYTR